MTMMLLLVLLLLVLLLLLLLLLLMMMMLLLLLIGNDVHKIINIMAACAFMSRSVNLSIPNFY
jgi:hypothetical protein